jgi:hypothetical protein
MNQNDSAPAVFIAAPVTVRLRPAADSGRAAYRPARRI